MSKFFIPSAVIEDATGGAIHQKMMVNWNDRGLWLTPVQPAERGKPRFYSYDNALEAMLAGAMVRSGMTRDRVSARIDKRCIDAFGPVAGWVGEAAKDLARLPEWSWEAGWWVFGDDAMLTIAITDPTNVPSEMLDLEVLHLVNVTKIKARLDAALADAGLLEAIGD